MYSQYFWNFNFALKPVFSFLLLSLLDPGGWVRLGLRAGLQWLGPGQWPGRAQLWGRGQAAEVIMIIIIMIIIIIIMIILFDNNNNKVGGHRRRVQHQAPRPRQPGHYQLAEETGINWKDKYEINILHLFYFKYHKGSLSVVGVTICPCHAMSRVTGARLVTLMRGMIETQSLSL